VSEAAATGVRPLALAKRFLALAWDHSVRPARVLQDCRRQDIVPDMVVGLTLAVVLLPQAIAYASIAELPPQMGLYAAVIGAIAGALWGSSRHLHTGPTNATSMLVLATLLAVAQPGTPEFLAAAGYLAVLAGVIRIVMGLAHMGVLVNFVADSVVLGFTAGAGLLIATNQMRHLLRLDLVSSPEFVLTLRATVAAAGDTHLTSLAVGAGTVLVIVAAQAVKRGLPAALLGMVLASAATAVLGLRESGVIVLGSLPRSLPPLADLPLASGDMLFDLAAGALAIAAIGLVEATSSARSIAAKSGQRLDTNQEFFGLGMANVLSGLFSGYPVGGSFTRSAVSYTAGGRTSLVAVFSGLWVLLAMFLFAPLAAYLPRAALAAVLLVTAWSMVDRTEIRRIVRTSKGDTTIMVATFLATLLLPLAFAVLAGMLVSFGRFLIKTSTPVVHPVVPDVNFQHLVRDETRPVCPQLGILRIEGSLYFGAVQHVEGVIRANREAHPGQTFLLLRMSMVDHCDVSGIHMLESTLRQYRGRGGDLFLSGLRPRVMEMLTLAGFDRTLGPANILDMDDAIGHLFHKVLHPGICVYECPHRVFAECQALPKDAHASDMPAHTDSPEHEIDLISPTTLKLLLADPGTPIRVIDVGEAREYRGWHVPGAESLPLRELRERADELMGEHSLCFVSRMGRRSSLAVTIMQDLGHERAFSLRGGMLAWEAAGFPIAVE
jgi:SulP family sulfate permease